MPAPLRATERAPSTDFPVGFDPQRFAARAQVASDAVRELARESRWTHASLQAARALHAFADALAISPLTLTDDDWRAAVRAVRHEALELERLSSPSLDRSDRIKAGLHACATALRSIRPLSGRRLANDLLATSLAAIDAIDANTHFGFQRAITQEAFRSLADTMLALASLRRADDVTAGMPPR